MEETSLSQTVVLASWNLERREFGTLEQAERDVTAGAMALSPSCDPVIHLWMAGETVAPDASSENIYTFALGEVAGALRIRSRTSIPSVDHGMADDRRLGVAIKSIELVSDDMRIRIEPTSPLLQEGFYDSEVTHRWTDGDALIPMCLLDLFGSRKVFISVAVEPFLTYPSAPGREFTATQALQVDGPISGPKLTLPDDHFEGVAFSDDGAIMGVAAAKADALLFFRRRPDGHFEDTPFRRFGGTGSGFVFLHDVVFARIESRQYVAAVERSGRVSIWAIDVEGLRYCDALIGQFAIDLVEAIDASKDAVPFTDSLAFLAEDDDVYVAICEFTFNVIMFYRVELTDRFAAQLVSTFTSSCLRGAEGLAISPCGCWLAVTSHLIHAVNIFQRRVSLHCAGPVFDPAPIATFTDLCLRHPHSVAFMPGTSHLIVTNSGAPDVHVFAFNGDRIKPQWSAKPAATISFTPDDIFHKVRAAGFAAEGGAKGVAVHGNQVALCSPERGVQLFTIRSS